MSTELTIVFDGDDESLKKHRLSVGDFGKPLALLLAALRRTASRIVVSALEDDEYGGGRLAKAARDLDLQITAVADGCVRIELECVQPPVTQLKIPGFDDLVEQTMIRLVDDLDAEAKGKLRNAPLRKFLSSLPTYVTTQRYIARAGGNVLREVELSAVTVGTATTTTSRLVRVVGTIAAVGLEQGKEFVAIRTEDGRARYAATAQLIDRALTLRAAPIAATVLEGARPRLLRVDAADVHVGGSPESRVAHITKSFAGALERLAK